MGVFARVAVDRWQFERVLGVCARNVDAAGSSAITRSGACMSASIDMRVLPLAERDLRHSSRLSRQATATAPRLPLMRSMASTLSRLTDRSRHACSVSTRGARSWRLSCGLCAPYAKHTRVSCFAICGEGVHTSKASIPFEQETLARAPTFC